MLLHLLIGPNDVVGQVLSALSEAAAGHVLFDRSPYAAQLAPLQRLDINRSFARRLWRLRRLGWLGTLFALRATGAALVGPLQKLLDLLIELRPAGRGLGRPQRTFAAGPSRRRRIGPGLFAARRLVG